MAHFIFIYSSASSTTGIIWCHIDLFLLYEKQTAVDMFMGPAYTFFEGFDAHYVHSLTRKSNERIRWAKLTGFR